MLWQPGHLVASRGLRTWHHRFPSQAATSNAFARSSQKAHPARIRPRPTTPTPLSITAAIPPNRFSRLALALPSFTLPAVPSLTSLSEILLAHPFPTYTATIVLLTVLVRSVFTLPATLWSRRRMKKMREIVRPEMQRVNERLAVQVMQECRKKGFGYDEYKKELKRQLANHQSALLKQHNCHPLATGLLPAFIHIPIFLLLSLTIRQAAGLATPAPIDPATLESSMDALTTLSYHAHAHAHAHAAFANEHVLWLSSLIDPDPTLIIPFAVGLMAFANVEVMQSWRGAKTNEDPAASGVSVATTAQPIPSESNAAGGGAPKRTAQPPAPTPAPAPKLKPNFGRISSTQKHPIVQDETAAGNMSPAEQRARQLAKQGGTMRERVVGNVMRILAVVMVGIAAELPAAVVIYWFTSTGFTLLQNLVLGYLDKRAAARVVTRG
ncbi:hypothetical protein QFC21_000809 [Naganishia friedmannii]|uniref:Uncharacterized protein n=1 Tax=Naganishia friedmannii TaxID=89922 RepID=A0ACC2W840_9TREE|nr:hypothetical protein QFC21_000809 [Naganishia friedmannii]